MFDLPKFEITVHIKKNEFIDFLESKIEQIMANFFLYESFEYNGIKDFHWGFSEYDHAISAVKPLEELIDNPNLLLLQIKPNSGNMRSKIVHKDIRQRS